MRTERLGQGRQRTNDGADEKSPFRKIDSKHQSGVTRVLVTRSVYIKPSCEKRGQFERCSNGALPVGPKLSPHVRDLTDGRHINGLDKLRKEVFIAGSKVLHSPGSSHLHSRKAVPSRFPPSPTHGEIREKRSCDRSYRGRSRWHPHPSRRTPSRSGRDSC